MKYYEIQIMVQLKKDIMSNNCLEVISKNINYSLLKYENFHNSHKIKGYVFNSFYPVESDKVYKKSNNYFFTIRMIDSVYNIIGDVFSVGYETDDFKVMFINSKYKKFKRITSIQTLTPTLIRKDAKTCWIKQNNSIIDLKNRLNINMSRKRDYFLNGDGNDYDFIESIIIKNKKPIKVPYKNFNYLCNKFEIIVKQDDISQQMAFLALSMGLGHGNSFSGFGFCINKED